MALIMKSGHALPGYFISQHLLIITKQFSPILKARNYQRVAGRDLRNGHGLAIEKPFGRDLDTARHLDKLLAKIFEERQIYRVDHYLGKETMQNMIAFRFANSIFEPVWNKEHIDHVQITWAEKEGVRTRGKFFDGIGILRDVGQNHLLQMLATVAMEQPNGFFKESVRDARANAIKAIRCPKVSRGERSSCSRAI